MENIPGKKRLDHEKFVHMWQALAYAKTERQIPIIRIAITDCTPWPNDDDFRICDAAVSELQRVVSVDFGATIKGSEEERNKALEKAKQWLEEHP